MEQNLNSEVLEINHIPFSALALVKVTSFCLETVASKMVKKSCKKWKVIKLKNYCGTNDCENKYQVSKTDKTCVPVSLRLRMYPLGDINCDKNSTSYGTRISTQWLIPLLLLLLLLLLLSLLLLLLLLFLLSLLSLFILIN